MWPNSQDPQNCRVSCTGMSWHVSIVQKKVYYIDCPNSSITKLDSVANSKLFVHILQVAENNKRNSKSGQLLAQKAQAVKNIMQDYDPEARDLLIQYTIEIGHEQTPWTDDNLSSKKCLPGYQFP